SLVRTVMVVPASIVPIRCALAPPAKHSAQRTAPATKAVSEREGELVLMLLIVLLLICPKGADTHRYCGGCNRLSERKHLRSLGVWTGHVVHAGKTSRGWKLLQLD